MIGGVESGRSAFIKVSMSRVRDVDVGIVDGRCRFIKLHELSTEVEFLIWSATSFVGVGGREALHMLGVRRVGCQ